MVPATGEGEMHLIYHPSPDEEVARQLWLRWNSSLSADWKGRRVDVSLSLFPTAPNVETWAVNTSDRVCCVWDGGGMVGGEGGAACTSKNAIIIRETQEMLLNLQIQRW